MNTTQHYLTTPEIIAGAKAPIDIGVVPNHIGVNLVSLRGVAWIRRDDGQLVSLTFHFRPANEKQKR